MRFSWKPGRRRPACARLARPCSELQKTSVRVSGSRLPANGSTAFRISVPSIDPMRVRCLEIRGHAEAITSTGQTQQGLDGALIRIHPERIISFGIDIPDQDPQAMTPHNRDVTRR